MSNRVQRRQQQWVRLSTADAMILNRLLERLINSNELSQTEIDTATRLLTATTRVADRPGIPPGLLGQ